MLFKKIITGVVEQLFNDAGECVSQQFVSMDEQYGFEYETEDGDPINMMDMPLGGREEFPCEMKQPNGG